MNRNGNLVTAGAQLANYSPKKNHLCIPLRIETGGKIGPAARDRTGRDGGDSTRNENILLGTVVVEAGIVRGGVIGQAGRDMNRNGNLVTAGAQLANYSPKKNHLCIPLRIETGGKIGPAARDRTGRDGGDSTRNENILLGTVVVEAGIVRGGVIGQAGRDMNR